MDNRPSYAHIRNAQARGVCPWCSHSTEGLTEDMCPECGNNVRALKPLGPRDPGSPGLASLCSLVAVALILIVAVVQQRVESAFTKQAAPAAATSVEPPSGQFELTAKAFVKIASISPDPAGKQQLGAQATGTLDAQAATPADKLRVAMVSGELEGDEKAISRLDKLEAEPDLESNLAEDCKSLRALYAGEPLTPEVQTRLEKNHGWIGKLAATHGKPDTDPSRAPLIDGGGKLMALVFGAVAGIILVFIAAFTCFIIAMVKIAGRTLRPRFIPPTPGGSIAIEMVVVFVLGFLALKGLSLAAEHLLGAKGAVWFSLGAQWCLLLILLWPALRGWRGGLSALGWNKGQGVLTEIGCGLFGYLACLPLVLFGAIVSIILMLTYQAVQVAMGHKAPPAPDNPVFELASGKGGVWLIVVIYILASVWAPIMEESIFRGALYRHLRSHWPWFPAAAVSAIGFGLMHNYPLLMLGPVMSLGFGFALIREWRGSLIASMTAHCVHNAAVLAVVLFAVHLIGG